jgi:hypothetical protein
VGHKTLTVTSRYFIPALAAAVLSGNNDQGRKDNPLPQRSSVRQMNTTKDLVTSFENEERIRHTYSEKYLRESLSLDSEQRFFKKRIALVEKP